MLSNIIYVYRMPTKLRLRRNRRALCCCCLRYHRLAGKATKELRVVLPQVIQTVRNLIKRKFWAYFCHNFNGFCNPSAFVSTVQSHQYIEDDFLNFD